MNMDTAKKKIIIHTYIDIKIIIHVHTLNYVYIKKGVYTLLALSIWHYSAFIIVIRTSTFDDHFQLTRKGE